MGWVLHSHYFVPLLWSALIVSVPSVSDIFLCRLHYGLPIELFMWVAQGGLQWAGMWVDVVLFGCNIRSIYAYSKSVVWVVAILKKTSAGIHVGCYCCIISFFKHSYFCGWLCLSLCRKHIFLPPPPPGQYTLQPIQPEESPPHLQNYSLTSSHPRHPLSSI